MYFNETWYICLVVLSCYQEYTKICLEIFGDSVMQTLRSGETRKSDLIPMSRYEKLADLSLVFIPCQT